MNKIRIYSITTNLSRYGGAQKVLKDIHDGLSKCFSAKILGTQKYEKLHPKYKIQKGEYIRLRNPFLLKDSIILVHARNMLPLIFLLNRIFFLNAKIVFVSHTVFKTYKKLTPLPKTLVAISNTVSENLVNFFSRKAEDIHLIHNGVIDSCMPDLGLRPDLTFRRHQKIRILYIAKIYPLKQQIEIVKRLKNKLSPDIELYFAGDGEELKELEKLCEGSTQFFTLGFIENIHAIISEYDFVMLYSKQEGLPISLIEGVMHSKPLLVNDVGGNLEIGIPNKNAIVLSQDWNIMIEQLNRLCDLSAADYYEMSLKSRENYLKFFQYDSMIEKYAILISNL